MGVVEIGLLGIEGAPGLVRSQDMHKAYPLLGKNKLTKD